MTPLTGKLREKRGSDHHAIVQAEAFVWDYADLFFDVVDATENLRQTGYSALTLIGEVNSALAALRVALDAEGLL